MNSTEKVLIAPIKLTLFLEGDADSIEHSQKLHKGKYYESVVS